jgi:hypothetical protein
LLLCDWRVKVVLFIMIFLACIYSLLSMPVKESASTGEKRERRTEETRPENG